MDTEIVRLRLMLVLLLVLALPIIFVPQFLTGHDLLALVAAGERSTADRTELQVHFLDVGQGDATLIETPDGVQVLIDGGMGRQVLSRLAEVMAPLDRSIDMVVATHPHDDHVGGLVDVLERFAVDHVMITENRSGTDTAERFLATVTAAETDGTTLWHARAGQEFALGASTTMRVLAPRYDPTDLSADASSIAVQISYGETAILFTGDAPSAIEDVLVTEYGSGLASELLKLGHHGSRTSTGDHFLDAVEPQYGVTSAGRDSYHGHPHQEVLDRLTERGIEHYTTQTAGTLSFTSDGTVVTYQE